jgi:hypothetical protein
MSLWEYEECLAIFWYNTGDVLGVRVKIKNHKLELLDTAALQVEGDNFGPAISEISKKLLLPSTHLIIAGGTFEESVCFDLTIPVMPESDIKQAIQYELPRHIPCEPSDIVLGYRILKTKTDENKAPKLLIRVFAIMKKAWNELITDFTSSGVKFDAVVHPYMLLDPILGDEDEFYLPEVDRDFKLVKDESGASRQMVQIESGNETDFDDIQLKIPSFPEKMNYDTTTVSAKINDEKLEYYIPVLLQAAFGLSTEFREKKNHLISLPKELLPERFRRLRALFVVFLLFTFLLIAALIGRTWWDDWSRLASLKQANKSIQNRIQVHKTGNQKLEDLEENIIRELLEAETGNNNITRCFHKLSITMPKEMWLSHFSTRDNSIDMSIKSAPGKQSKILSALNASGLFKTKSSYKRTNTDGTENIYIHLDVINPSGNKGGK